MKTSERKKDDFEPRSDLPLYEQCEEAAYQRHCQPVDRHLLLLKISHTGWQRLKSTQLTSFNVCGGLIWGETLREVFKTLPEAQRTQGIASKS